MEDDGQSLPLRAVSATGAGGLNDSCRPAAEADLPGTATCLPDSDAGVSGRPANRSATAQHSRGGHRLGPDCAHRAVSAALGDRRQPRQGQSLVGVLGQPAARVDDCRLDRCPSDGLHRSTSSARRGAGVGRLRTGRRAARPVSERRVVPRSERRRLPATGTATAGPSTAADLRPDLARQPDPDELLRSHRRDRPLASPGSASAAAPPAGPS